MLIHIGIRTYRERKEAYAKALEREVAKSKAREAELILENERLQGTIKRLVGKLEEHGVEGVDDIIRSTPAKDARSPKPDNMSSPAPPLARLGDVDPVALGMDFVLA